MNIKHVFHSGFEFELNNKLFLIDVYTDLKDYKDRDIYFFVTHSHGDHYNPEISKLRVDNNIKYIVSSDVPMTGDDVYVVNKGDKLILDDLNIAVFGTTDLGVSYHIDYFNTKVFHSGDLNWWHWENDSIEVQKSEADQYKGEIEALMGYEVDYAFVPYDYRLKEANRLAMDYFIKKINPKYLIPMHFANEYHTLSHLRTESNTILLGADKPNSYVKEIHS